jgi:ATP-dependent helicase HrpB
LARRGALILTAPAGSGKSTQTPQFLLERRGEFPGRILVLEPRRLAARSLAGRVASETRTRLADQVGYQVRFDSRCGRDTPVVFATYGVFLQRMLDDPALGGVGTVLLDEFHERTLESDLALAWLKVLRQERRRDLRLAVMSATLDAAQLCRYLPGAVHVDVPGRLFPVEIRHLPAEPREGLAQHALRALRLLHGEGLDGTALVFMPGMREILRTTGALGPFCRERGLLLQTLHGSMELSEQQKVLDPDQVAGRVIVSTNVAETSVTIPGVAAVIDSGLHRIAAYSPARDINTLYLARISRGNAAQRAGRAGRTAAGCCIRLWSLAEEAAMPEAVQPEILRLELSALLLRSASLPGRLDWLTPPPEKARQAAQLALSALGAVSAEDRITTRGRALLRYPVCPRLGSVLLGARSLGAEAHASACAMAAVLESAVSRRTGRALDLAVLGEELRQDDDEDLPWEAGEIFQQLRRLGEAGLPDAKGRPAASDLAGLWLEAYADRLAARQGESMVYQLVDGRKALLPLEKGRMVPRLILALEIEETAGAGQARQTSVPVYLPCEPDMVRERFPQECLWRTDLDWDGRQRKVLKREKMLFRGLAIADRQAAAGPADRKALAAVWAEKFACGELRHPGRDEKVEQLLVRVQLARKYYPELSFPEMDADDWRLIYEDACAGRNSWLEMERVSLEAQLDRYLGPALRGFLEKTFPVRKKLPSGRTGKLTYFERQPPELAARLEDLLGMNGALNLCEGRLPVLFDILSPASRTVQKTQDLGSFWKNAYPSVKKELQRRYPRHPWP